VLGSFLTATATGLWPLDRLPPEPRFTRCRIVRRRPGGVRTVRPSSGLHCRLGLRETWMPDLVPAPMSTREAGGLLVTKLAKGMSPVEAKNGAGTNCG
jgi:hypothetical protein